MKKRVTFKRITFNFIKKRLLFLILAVLCMTGCTKAEKVTDFQEETAAPSPEPSSPELFVERAETFVLAYDGHKTDLTVSIKDCTCEYDYDRVQIYSKQINSYEWSDSAIDLPQYVLYIQTPYETTQIFPVKDFRINEESENLYILQENSDFQSVLQISDFRRQKGSVIQSECTVLDDNELMKMIEEAHGFNNADTSLDALFFKFVSVTQENDGDILTGEASWKTLNGEKYYVDFKWEEATGKGSALPYIFRIYDKQKDKEEFEKCEAAYDLIMGGDLSSVSIHSHVEYDSLWETYDRYEFETLEIREDDSWIQADVNNDGMMELIRQNGNGNRAEHKKPIDLIFAYHDGGAELVYTDFADAMEFLYLSEKGALIYENTVLGSPQESYFTKYYFDAKWNLEFEESLRLLYFQEREYDKEESDRLKEIYPAFKNHGEGLYYIHYPSGEYLSRREFLDHYENMTGQDFFGDHAFYWEFCFEEAFSDEKFYEYEIRKDDTGSDYAVITGIAEPYRDNIKETLYKLTMNSWKLYFPETLEGAPVREIAPYAFRDMDLGYESLYLPSCLTLAGEGCFENCGLYDVIFEKDDSSGKAPVIGDRAFADNENLYGVYLNAADTVLGKDVFDGCRETLYLCYTSVSKEADGRLAEYAKENHLEAVEIPLYYYTEGPVVNYPETPLLLTPEISNFFYGESADDEDFCSFEYSDSALNFGFPEWQIPCGESDAMIWFIEAAASSELASAEEDKYAAWHMSVPDRNYVWAEGAEGNGIGESISITESCGDGRKWEGDGTVNFYEGDIEPDILDGYIRYTEICIVNGYAKNKKTWEENGRVKRLLMYVEDKPYAYLDLEDTLYPQYFKLPINDIKAADCVDVHFKFVIEDIYSGTKYEDTCLTGLQIEFIGRHSH